MGAFLAIALLALFAVSATRDAPLEAPAIDTETPDVASPPANDPGPVARGDGTIAAAQTWEWYESYAGSLPPGDPAREAIESELNAIRAQGAAL
jgi:hypothetical protein